MRCTAAASPATHTRGRVDVGVAERGDERVAGRALRRASRATRRSRAGAAVGRGARRVRDLDVHRHRRRRGQHLEQLAHRRYRRLVAREQERGASAVDRVAPTGSRDRGSVAGSRPRPPIPTPAPPPCSTTSRSSSSAIGIDAARRERADRGAAPIREQELVAVPRGHHERSDARRREQEADARRGKVDRETFELRAGQRDAQEPRAHVRRPLHLDTPKARRLASDAERVGISVSAAHANRLPSGRAR